MREADETREEKAEEGDWLGGLGIGAIAAMGAGVFALSLLAMIMIGQVRGALTGDVAGSGMAIPEVEGVSFEAPPPALAVSPLRVDAAAWLRNAAPFGVPAGTPLIAVVVLDDGAQSSEAMRALGWSVPISLAIAADFDLSPHRVQQVRAAGQEALALLPLGYGPDLGSDPNVLRRGLAEGELLRRLRWHLARAGEGIVGAVDLHGGDILRDPDALRILGDGLAAEGLLAIDSGEDPGSLLAARLRAMGRPVGRGMVRIERGAMQDTAFDAFARAEDHAATWGAAIVLIEAGSDTMDALALWVRTRSESVALAPVSHVVRRLRRAPGHASGPASD